MIYVQTSPTGNTLRTAAVDGSGDRELFAALPDDCPSFYRPAWNPTDQTEIAVPCVTAAGTVQVHLLSVDGTEVGTLDTGLPTVDDLTYSPDGGTLAFWGSAAQGADGTIFTQPADGSASPQRLVEPVAGAGDADPTFSPDGSMIAFRRLQTDAAGDTTAQLILVGSDGSNPTPLTDGTSVDQDPIFSPDGTELAFKSNRLNAAGTRDNQFWVIGRDGSGLRELGVGSPGSADGAPAWGHR
jgi:Tol biopolymer transport system component